MLPSPADKLLRRDLVLDPETYRPPAEGLQTLVAGWWAQALGLDRVGAQDDFFALGGDSVAAEALFAAIQGEFHLELTSALLLDAPTVADLAAAIHQALAADRPVIQQPSPVVLRPGTGPDTLVLVPPRRQKELAYRRLAQRLAFAGPVVMLHHPPLESMAAVADAHLQALAARGLGPRLHLVGECWGGLLTLEMVRRAGTAGLQAGVVALFDPPPLLRRADRLRTRYGHLLPVAAMGLVADRVQGYRRRLQGTSWRERAALLARKGSGMARRLVRQEASADLRAELGRTLRMERERITTRRDPLSRAGLRYAPRAPRVPVELLVTRDRAPGPFRDSRAAWVRFLRAEGRITEVPGHHTGDTVWGHTDALAAAIDALVGAARP